MNPRPKRDKGLAAAGFAVAALSLLVPLLGLAALAIGILVLTRDRVVAGAAIIAVGVTFALASSAFYTLALDTYRIPSESMHPTLRPGNRILVSRLSQPNRGDVVVSEAPVGALSNMCGADHSARQACPEATTRPSGVDFVQRVVAVGGDRLAVRGGRAYVNGEESEAPGVSEDVRCPLCDLPEEITIPDDHVFLMGDNRAASADSRVWGPVPEDWVVGDAVLRYWPPGDFGGL